MVTQWLNEDAIRHLSPDDFTMRATLGPDREVIPALSAGPFVATKTGLRIYGDPTPDEFDTYLRAMLSVTERVLWIVGDAILYGEQHCPDVVDAIIESGVYQRQTLSNARWVASRVQPNARNPELAWSMHQAVASLEPQDQVSLLGAAEDLGWTRDELRDAVRQTRGETVDLFREELCEARRALTRLLGVANTDIRIDGVRLALAALENLEVDDV